MVDISLPSLTYSKVDALKEQLIITSLAVSRVLMYRKLCILAEFAGSIESYFVDKQEVRLNYYFVLLNCFA